jgi:hypothetical protein
MTDMTRTRAAYRDQIEFGNTPETALGLAMIVYLRRNPRVPVREARSRVVKALGIKHRQRDCV